jgi:hypothetical protein
MAKYTKCDLKKFCREALLWRGLNHSNVLPFYGIDLETFLPRMVTLMCHIEALGGPISTNVGKYVSAHLELILINQLITL